MTALNRKLLRDLAHLKGQAIAIGLVIACGVATFVMSRSTARSLRQAQDLYYEQHRFAQVFAHLKRAPNALADRIAEIPGVAQVQTRVVVDVTLDVPGMIEPAVGRLISIPVRPSLARERPRQWQSANRSSDGDLTGHDLNELYLRRGRYPEAGREGEVLVNEPFAEAHGFNPGDTLKAVINGKLEELHIVGIALSPEYVYQIRAGDLFPDNRRFGVFWMADTELAPGFDLEGAFNDVTLRLGSGASEPEVLKRLDDLTGPYGCQGAYTRADQVSHRYVSDELSQLRAMALIPSVIFLAVAAFLLNVVLNRLIGLQREQIAALKAFGYTRLEIGRHYLWLALLIVFCGTALGVAGGAWLGYGMTQMYTRFFRFPLSVFHLDPEIVLLAWCASAVAGTLGVAGAVRRAMKLPPAEAMRPEPPADYHPTLVERLGLQRIFTQTARMILRELERKPARALLSTLGIALGVAILVLGSFTEDILNYVIEFQFYVSQRHDFTVAFVEPTAGRALHAVQHLPGVLRSEAFRTVPGRLRSGHLSRRVAIMGLPPDRELFRLMDLDQRAVPLPEEGLVVSEKLAELLLVKAGDPVTVEVLEGERPSREVVVAGVVRDFSGTAAYMDLRALNLLMREGPVITGAFLRCDPNRTDDLYAKLKSTPRVSSVSSQRAALASFEETVSENLLRMRFFNVLFGSIIAFGVVYNTARITLSEHRRELATLRVIGFTRGEISGILLGEIAVLTLAALPVGMAAGYGFAALATFALETETQRFPLVVSSATFAFAVTVTLLASVFSGLVVRRRLDELDLVSVLKAPE